jgi:type IV pilus biogenesis protein CpaD/CtpE
MLLLAGCSAPAPPPRPTAQQPCPQWTAFPADRHSNADSPYLGCTNAANLRSMAADPADLDRGRTLGAADGEVAARTVDAYRQGKVKTAPSSGASGAATQSGGSPSAP